MKGFKLLFASCLLSLVNVGFNYATADDAVEAARAATRRGTSTTVVRQQQDTPTEAQTIKTSGVSRSTNVSSSGSTVGVRDRTSSSTIRSNVVSRESDKGVTDNDTNQAVSARTTSTVLPRTTTSTPAISATPARTAVTRDTVTTISRTGATESRNVSTAASEGRAATSTTARTASVNRTGSTLPTVLSSRNTVSNTSARISRAGSVTATEIIQRDYTQCREVYYSCMDEFCANKDSQLKRCACSSRVNEFDSVKDQLTEIEDKLLDFNQRLLTVNMDKEDAEAIFQATEGEIAFQQEDQSESKKLLDEIAEKLNKTFDTSTFDTNLAPISLSLNVDAAFDTVDSLAGASTTTKSGTALYSAALPICREMALEVCTQDELDIVESGYQMAIEQDCNTVSKAYQTQQDLAREKIREGSALLDMSRLDIYQKRNSDDILTCKKKMLDMLSDTSVCGTDLQKCLDISGQYIDPSTGDAILTINLVNLGNLITRPAANQTWTNTPGNEKFVSYLNSKKMFLESATENCQDIADYIWDEFIEDALAQIKLAQENKLEEVRQSCTTLTTQCLTTSAESLEDFDARALSIFGVEADKTVKQMCAEVQTACTALLDTVDGGTDWGTGMTDIATNKTYETILQTCREVGRACIIQSCKSISGNFGLCENIQTSVNRKSIINRTACWPEVLKCVKDAGIESINKITTLQANYIDSNGSFYNQLYGTYTASDITNDELEEWFDSTQSCIITSDNNCIYDICAKECGFNAATSSYTSVSSDECQECRLAEKIWGNCEAHPTANVEASEAHNKIKIPIKAYNNTTQETLLSWFAKNTNTEDATDSCRDTSCGPGFVSLWDGESQSSVCVPRSSISDDGQICPTDTFWQVNVGRGLNCCNSGGAPGARDVFGNCCLGTVIGSGADGIIPGVIWDTSKGYWNQNADGTSIGKSSTGVTGNLPATNDGGLCLPTNAKFVVAFPFGTDSYYGNQSIGFLFCTGSISGDNIQEVYPNGQTIKCSGDYIIVTKTGKYVSPHYDSGTVKQNPHSFYREANTGTICTQQYLNNQWVWQKEDDQSSCPAPTRWIMQY